MSELKYSKTNKSIECPVCHYAHFMKNGGKCIEALKTREAALRVALKTLVEAIQINGSGFYYDTIINGCYSDAKAALKNNPLT